MMASARKHPTTSPSSSLPYLKLSLAVLAVALLTFYGLNRDRLQNSWLSVLNRPLDLALDTWHTLAYSTYLIYQRLLGRSVTARVHRELIESEGSVPVRTDARIAIGLGACTDLVVDAIPVLRSFPTPRQPQPHDSIESMQSLLELFAYYFKHGAASERYIKSKAVFNELLELVNKSKFEYRKVVGGNAPIMSVRFAKEGIRNILLGAQVSAEFARWLPDNVQVSGPRIEQDDYHVLLEYKTGQRWGQYQSPRANRLIVHSDDNNAQLVSRRPFLDQVIHFRPNLLIISGLQMLDNSQASFDVRSKAIQELASDLDKLRQKEPSLRVHFEMASYTENRLLDVISNTIFPHADSFGMNEQEVANLLSFLRYGNISYVTSPFPRIASVLDQMRELYSLLHLSWQGKVSRVHVHTLAYQVVMVKLDAQSNQPMWPASEASMSKASLTAYRHTCGKEQVDLNTATILLDNSFRTSNKPHSGRIQLDRATKCWIEDLVVENDSIRVEFCLATGLVCTDVKQTGGAGDNVSGNGFIFFNVRCYDYQWLKSTRSRGSIIATRIAFSTRRCLTSWCRLCIAIGMITLLGLRYGSLIQLPVNSLSWLTTRQLAFSTAMDSCKFRERVDQLVGLQRHLFRDLLPEAASWSTLNWLSTREFNPPRFQDSLDRTSEQVMRDVFNEPFIENYLQKHPENKKQIEAILREMEHRSSSVHFKHFMHCVALSTMKHVLEHCFLETRLGPKDDLLNLVGDLAQRKRIIFLPTHRSYIDFLLHYLFVYYLNLTEIPAGLAGDNLKNLSVVSDLLTAYGLFWVRRNFGLDHIYSRVFRAYVQSMVVGGEKPLTFSLEGTRSRSGKNYWPRLGMLKTVLEPLLRGQIEDLILVPVTISYERFLEEDVFAKEVSPLFDAYAYGTEQAYEKPKENIWNLLSSFWTIQWKNYGELYWRLGKPISVAEKISSHPNMRELIKTHTKTPLVQEINLGETEKDFIFQLAVRIQQAQDQALVVSTFSLAAVIMLAESTLQPAIFDLESLGEDLSSLALLIPDHLNITINGLGVERDLERSIRVHSNLEMSLDSSRLVVSMEHPQTVAYLRMYANQAMSLLIDHAIALYTDGDITLFKQVRLMLQREFICHPNQLDQLYASHYPHFTTKLTARAKRALLAQVKFYLTSYYRMVEWFHAQPNTLYHQVASLEFVKNLLVIPKDVVSNTFQVGIKSSAFVMVDQQEGTFSVDFPGAKKLLEQLSKLIRH